jgi:hypothetical protein
MPDLVELDRERSARRTKLFRGLEALRGQLNARSIATAVVGDIDRKVFNRVSAGARNHPLAAALVMAGLAQLLSDGAPSSRKAQGYSRNNTATKRNSRRATQSQYRS